MNSVHMDFHMERTLKAVHGSLNVTVPKQLADALGWRKGHRISFQQQKGGLLMQATEATKPVLVTIGYEGHTPDSFVRALKQDQVEILVDIRDLPLSRRRGFSKSTLAASLDENGIEYRHMKGLGAPKDIRTPYKEGSESWGAFKAAYERHLAGQKEALEALTHVAEHHRAAIMCVEKVHSMCHRGLVASHLAATGFRIVHV